MLQCGSSGEDGATLVLMSNYLFSIARVKQRRGAKEEKRKRQNAKRSTCSFPPLAFVKTDILVCHGSILKGNFLSILPLGSAVGVDVGGRRR